MSERHHPPRAEIRMETLLQAVSDPLRLRILDLLDRNGETACTEAYAKLGQSKANASHHFRILREAGVIRATMHGRDLHTKIRYDDLNARFPGFLKSVLCGWRQDQEIQIPHSFKSPHTKMQN